MATGALLAASFVFYGYQKWWLCFLLAVSIIVNYTIHLFLVEICHKIVLRRVLLVGGLAINFGLLFYYKYLDFAIENVNALTGSQFVVHNVILPLGISFYTFQQVSFVIDSYKGGINKYHFLEYALFVAFFPQLVAGPIVLHSEIIPQFTNLDKKRIDFSNLISGSEYLILGLAKKVLLADSFSRICDVGYNTVRTLNSISALTVMLAYTLEIYFDFSGYCDMAVGIGRLFNIEIPVNFKSPYKAINIEDFWKRWHITLTRFLTTYLYIPLGGNRKGKWRTYCNILIVFALSGLWHGANWSFVVWGLMHGVMMVLYRANQKKADRLPKWFTWLITFGFVNFAWMFFGMESEKLPLILCSRVFSGGLGGLWSDLSQAFCDNSFLTAVMALFVNENIMGMWKQIWTFLWLAGGMFICVGMPSSHEIVGKKVRKQGYFFALSVVFFMSLLRLSEISKFIYFNF